MSKKKKLIVFLIAYTLFAVLLFASTSYSTTVIHSRMLEEKQICISENWSYESSYSSKNISVAEFVKRYPMESGKEYIIKGMLPIKLTGSEALYFYSQNLELTVWIDGERVYEVNTDSDNGISGIVENIVPLPFDAAGKEVVITYQGEGAYRFKAIDAIYLGEESEFVKAVFVNQLPVLAFAFLFFSIALIQLIASIVMRGETTYQMNYLGWTTLVYSFWMLGSSRVMDFFSDYRFNGQNIRHYALAMIAFPILKYIYLRFDVKETIWDRCLEVIAFLNFPFVLILRLSGVVWDKCVLVTYLILMAVFARILYEQAEALKKCRNGMGEKRTYAILNMIAFGIMATGSIVDIVKYVFSIGQERLYFSPICFLIMNCILSYRSLDGALNMMRLGKRSETVKQMAYFDMLTQVYNRTALNEDMEKYEKTKKEKKNFGIVVFDVNNLKWVNDNLGHLAGDKLLQDSAAVIRDGFEGYGKTYRFGGDEFVVVMEDGAKEKYSFGILQMEKLLAKHNEKVKKDEKISIAYGVAYYDGSDEQTLWQVHENADCNMYQRKREMKARMNDGKDVRKNEA